MGHDSLTHQDARKFIGRAGGTTNVAEKLGVSVKDVTRWSREGLLDEDLAIRLMDLGEFRVCRYGSPPRCKVLLPGELELFVSRVGGPVAAAQWLNTSIRTLRRYRAGHSNPTEEQADRIRAWLAPTALTQQERTR